MSTSPIPQHREAAAWVPLLLEILNQKGHCRWPLRGHSMRPTLPPDCEIDVAPLPPRVALGALIVFANGDALVAHRLVRRAGNAWIAQGDNRRRPDKALNPAQVLGVVRGAYLPNQQQCWPSTFSGALAWFWIARYHMLRAARFAIRTMYGRPRG